MVIDTRRKNEVKNYTLTTPPSGVLVMLRQSSTIRIGSLNKEFIR